MPVQSQVPIVFIKLLPGALTIQLPCVPVYYKSIDAKYHSLQFNLKLVNYEKLRLPSRKSFKVNFQSIIVELFPSFESECEKFQGKFLCIERT